MVSIVRSLFALFALSVIIFSSFAGGGGFTLAGIVEGLVEAVKCFGLMSGMLWRGLIGFR